LFWEEVRASDEETSWFILKGWDMWEESKPVALGDV